MKSLPPHLKEEERDVVRYFVRDRFNPASPKQILEYMNFKGLAGKPNKKSKSGNPSTDEATLERLARKDAVFKEILRHREIKKIEGTYVESNLSRMDKDDRVHPRFLHNPSTWRLSSAEPNWQNIPDAEEEDSLAHRFRTCVVAAPDHTLVSADYAAIEAIETGYFSGDPNYMRLAIAGVHSYLVSHKIGKPAELSWGDEQLQGYLAEIKTQYKKTPLYAGMKATVHLTNYGGSPHMMHKAQPELFPTIKAAEEMQEFYFALCPMLKKWQSAVRKRASQQNYLGGNDHPYHFKHWFWDVVAWSPRIKDWVPGSDWNKVVAFYPQSSAAGVLYDACLALAESSYCAENPPPIRALIHDEILAEVPTSKLDEYIAALRTAMEQPCNSHPLPAEWGMGESLRFRVDVKVGPNWGQMESVR